MPLTFLQLNMHKAGAAASELHRQLPRTNPDVLLLTEPPVYKNKVVTLPKGYQLFPSRALSEIPRAAILLKPELKGVHLSHLGTPDCTAVLVPTPLGTVLLASAYLDKDLPVHPDWLQTIYTYAARNNFGLIVGLDTNAHHTSYGNRTDIRGRDFMDALSLNNLSLANRGRTPTFDTVRGGRPFRSVIDVTVYSQVHINNWRVDSQYNGSDHNSILFDSPYSPPPPTTGRRWSKADWPLFTSHLEAAQLYTPRMVNCKKLDNMVANLYRAINEALDKACPLEEIKPPKPYRHWYDTDLKKMARQLKKQYRRTKRCLNPQETDKLYHLQKEYSKASRNKRQAAWKAHLTETDSVSAVARLNKVLQRTDRESINLFQKPDWSYTDPGQESAEFLFRTHFPTATPVTPVTYSAASNTPTHVPLTKYTKWINNRLVRKSLEGFQDKKSPGPDSLKPIVFKHLPSRVISFITSIYKISVHLKYTPFLWKQTRVIFIPKPGKDSYSHPKSFRPISLSNYLLKGLERLATWRVDDALQYSPLHSNQHGFLPGRGTESAISDVVNYVEQKLFQSQHCLGIFLDISAAFDSISIEHVRDSLYSHGIEPDLVEWYYHYLQRRDLHFSLHGITISLQTGLGFPQGGVASAKFWIIAFDPAMQILNQQGILGVGYADDCAAVFQAPRFDYAVLQMQKVLDELVAWGRTCNLTFNAAKTVAVVFSRSTRNFNSYQLMINNRYIPYSNSVRYLGLTLDKKLYFKEHIVQKFDKARGLLFKLKTITATEWGPPQLLMRWAYTGIVRPMLSYAAYVWAHEIHTTYISGKLDKLNRLALTLCTQVPKSTPSAALEVMLHVPPLPLFLTKLGLVAHYRLFKSCPLRWSGVFSNKTYSTSHRKYWERLVHDNDLPPLNTKYDSSCSLSHPGEHRFDIDYNSLRSLTPTSPSQINIYTDGSRTEQGTGAGYCIYEHDKLVDQNQFKLPDTSSVYQAELLAIQAAARALYYLPQARFVKIFVDSQAAIKALDMETLTSATVRQTVMALNKAPDHIRRISISWVKAHIGTTGNEAADQQAKSGCTSDQLIYIPPPLSYLKSRVDDFFLTSWKQFWTTSQGAEATKSFFLGPDPTKTKHLLRLPKKHTNLLIKLIADHTSLRKHSNKIDPSQPSSCRLCDQSTESFVHLLTECPPLRSLRDSIFLDRPHSPANWSVDKLRIFALSQPLQDLLRGFSDEDLHQP